MAETETAPDPFLVRNRMDTPTVLGIMGPRPIVLLERGDKEGRDLQPVSPEYRNDPAVIRSLQLGLIERVTVEQASEIYRAEGAFVSGFERMRANVGGMIDRSSENAMVGIPCVGRKANGAPCEGTGIVAARERDKVPALCPEHARYRDQLIAVSDEVKGGVVWMLPPEPAVVTS